MNQYINASSVYARLKLSVWFPEQPLAPGAHPSNLAGAVIRTHAGGGACACVCRHTCVGMCSQLNWQFHPLSNQSSLYLSPLDTLLISLCLEVDSFSD